MYIKQLFMFNTSILSKIFIEIKASFLITRRTQYIVSKYPHLTP